LVACLSHTVFLLTPPPPPRVLTQRQISRDHPLRRGLHC
jgi:hypothetical protein